MVNKDSPIIQNMIGNGEQQGIESITTQEAAQMANLTPAVSGYGLVSSPLQQFGTLGYNPYNQDFDYNNRNFNSGVQSFNPQFTYNRGANPQYNNGYNNYNYVYQDQHYMVQGYNPYASNVMYSSDYEERYQEINNQMNKELEEYNKNNVYNNYNYYGSFNRTNPFITEKYRKKFLELENEAKQRRIDFNKRLSCIAHTYLDGKPPEEEYLNNIYNEREVTIPAANVETYNLIKKFENYTVDISKIQAEEFNKHEAEATKYHNSIIDPNSTLLDFLENAGELYALGLQEEVIRAKRNKTNLYDNSDNYRKYLMRQIERRDGTVPNMFPNIMNSSNTLEDGTLQINVPDWMKNDKRALSEQKYAESKQQFIDSIYNPRRG